jgi:hypothetical protein
VAITSLFTSMSSYPSSSPAVLILTTLRFTALGDFSITVSTSSSSCTSNFFDALLVITVVIVAFFGDFAGITITSSSTNAIFLFLFIAVSLVSGPGPRDTRFFGVAGGSAADAIRVRFVDIVTEFLTEKK